MDELKNIIDKLNDAIKSRKTRLTALSSTMAIHKKRIFVDGKDATGGQIGQYSTNPISISKSKQARNTGRTYFKGGYSEYKTAIGKNTGYVNLRNTDQMQGDYNVIASGETYAFGFQNPFNYQKMGWMEEKFDKPIAELSDDELEKFAQVLVDELKK